MANLEDSLVMRRSKRSTAGNRMEAALAEFHAEDVGADVEEDADFVIDKDEEDAFESDFASTDEEAPQEEVDAIAEKMVQEDERRARKAVRSKLDRVTAAAHARQKATFNPVDEAETSTQPTAPKMGRRVSLGVAVNAETGEVVERKRQSSRRHTMLNTSATATRLKDAEEKKATLPKKARAKTRLPTQDELIARAFDMEEGNIVEHRNYLSLEEEKRKKARLMRTSVQGPLIRWISKREEIKVKAEPPPPPPPPQPALHPPYGYGYAYPYSQYPPVTSSGPSNIATPTYYHPSYQTQHPYYASSHQSPAPYTYPSYAANPSPAPPPPQVREPIERTEIVAKNYVVHEQSQSEHAVKIPWYSTMKAMFGDHVNWEALRVYAPKGRPLARPTQTCPITGKVAKYLDPRTNVPFADIEAYEVLTRILAHEYVWSDSLGCYVGRDEDKMDTDAVKARAASDWA